MTCARLSLLAVAIAAFLAPARVALAQEVTCYVDSVQGDDTKDGLSEANAVKTQAKIGKTCTAVRFKRGSVFAEAVKVATKVKYYGNYGDTSLPLPKFEIPRSPNNGSMLSAYQGGITVDGLYLAGSQSDANMANLGKGICVMLGSNSKLINNEITNCDIGIMLSGTGTLVQNNYVHDLHVSVDAAPGVDPNVVGGAEGIFVNGSNNEVAYNNFINCSNYAEWTGGSCDGGATEVTVGADGAELTGVKIHHNYSYNSCGFFEVSSMFSSDSANPVRGKFTNSEFYNNVTIDSGWLHLLQVANTDMHNIRWENNTLVQHKGSLNQGILMVVYTAVASGMSGGQLYEDSIYWTNNLFVADGVNLMNPDSRVNQSNNLIIKDASKQSPGFVNLKGSNATDYDLVEGSPAINGGKLLENRTLDFLNRAIPDPSSGVPDIGAFEYNSPQVSPPGQTPIGGSGGSPAGTGGASSPGGGGATSPATSGKGGAGGTTRNTSGAGGTATPATGAGGTSSVTTGKGGAGGSSPPPSSPSGNSGAGGSAASGGAAGSNPSGSGGSAGSGAVASGGADSGGAPGAGGAGGPTVSETAGASGCSCGLGQTARHGALWVSLMAFALLVARRRGRRG
jgi:parallel beta-helix repeat protein